MFNHWWDGEGNHCSKCNKLIEKNAFVWNESKLKAIFCEDCYGILRDDIELYVHKFIGKDAMVDGLITNDEWINLVNRYNDQ